MTDDPYRNVSAYDNDHSDPQANIFTYDDPPPGDPPPNPNPNNDPPPDPNANQPTIADLQRQVEEANQRAQDAATAGVTATRDALRAANPNLPDAAFAGDTIDALNTSVTAHRQTSDQAREQAEADAKATAAGHPPPGVGTIRTPQVPDGARGIGRIAFALQNPGPGMTE